MANATRISTGDPVVDAQIQTMKFAFDRIDRIFERATNPRPWERPSPKLMEEPDDSLLIDDGGDPDEVTT